jgi:hypothetical protein
LKDGNIFIDAAFCCLKSGIVLIDASFCYLPQRPPAGAHSLRGETLLGIRIIF